MQWKRCNTMGFLNVSVAIWLEQPTSDRHAQTFRYLYLFLSFSPLIYVPMFFLTFVFLIEFACNTFPGDRLDIYISMQLAVCIWGAHEENNGRNWIVPFDMTSHRQVHSKLAFFRCICLYFSNIRFILFCFVYNQRHSYLMAKKRSAKKEQKYTRYCSFANHNSFPFSVYIESYSLVSGFSIRLF